MGYEVIVLGGSGTFPAPDAACSGYLLRSGTTNLWVDAGPGTFANLQRHIDPAEITAILISHLHLDHVTDLYPFSYWKRYGPGAAAPPLDVYAPAGAGAHLGRVLGPDGDPTFGGHLNFKPVDESLILEVGDFEARFCRTRHPVETYAMRLTSTASTVAYTADTGPSPSVTTFAWGANLLIAEATLQASSRETADVHMSAAEAGDMAARACVSQLALTHLVPGLDPAVSREQAAREFRGEILVTSDNLRMVVY
jgi:ribonuclease BN (tRNA processing enzyme)